LIFCAHYANVLNELTRRVQIRFIRNRLMTPHGVAQKSRMRLFCLYFVNFPTFYYISSEYSILVFLSIKEIFIFEDEDEDDDE
jgi:hypothetical protein